MISSIEAIGTIQFIEYMPQTKALLDRNGLQTQTAELTSDSSSNSFADRVYRTNYRVLDGDQ